MRIAVIDADLIIGGKKHRFPNLASMKISSYNKSIGNNVVLELSYENIDLYDRVYISKVFEETTVPSSVLNRPNVYCGGTGFYYDKAPRLPYEIEHAMPDYDLYSDYVENQIMIGKRAYDYKEYTDISLGYTSRGCIRGCEFCVNKNYKRSDKHSPLSEFYNSSKKYICLLDDNVLACKDWRSIFDELIAIGKPFYYKQGLDERLLTKEKCEYLFNKSKYYGDYTFAFDRVEDYEIIERKLDLIRSYTDRVVKFYVFCGFISNSTNESLWVEDIESVFKRIHLLMRYRCLPYIMRHKYYEASPYRGMYVAIASWCNQPSIFKKKSLREFGYLKLEDGNKAVLRYLKQFEARYPDVAKRYYDMKFEEL